MTAWQPKSAARSIHPSDKAIARCLKWASGEEIVGAGQARRQIQAVCQPSGRLPGSACERIRVDRMTSSRRNTSTEPQHYECRNDRRSFAENRGCRNLSAERVFPGRAFAQTGCENSRRGRTDGCAHPDFRRCAFQRQWRRMRHMRHMREENGASL